MSTQRKAHSVSAIADRIDAGGIETPAPADTAVVARTNALNGALSATVRQLAIAIWQQHPDWEGAAAYSPFAACTYVEFTLPAYPNLRLQLFPGRRVHITNRIYWDATLISSFEVPAYTRRRHLPFFRRVIRATEIGCAAEMIDQWLDAHGRFYDALVEGEAASMAAKIQREQRMRQELWTQLLGPLPLDPNANIQTAEHRSTPRIKLTMGEVTINASPDGAALTIVLPPEQKERLPEVIAALNQMVSDLARTPLEKGNN